MEIEPIAYIETDFPEKFGIPRQSGLARELPGKIVFFPKFKNPEALRGLTEYTHLWLIWEFAADRPYVWSPTVRPPRLGGNKRMGVFATRSPNRPNRLGLSAVKLERIEKDSKLGTVIIVSGSDLMNGTLIYDIKPYLRYADCIPDASDGFALTETASLRVSFPAELLDKVPEDKRAALIEVLSQDPRPQYQNDPERIYTMSFADLEISFSADESSLEVVSVERRISR